MQHRCVKRPGLCRWTALWTRHAGRQQEALLPRLLNITGIQIGLVIGALWWWIAG